MNNRQEAEQHEVAEQAALAGNEQNQLAELLQHIQNGSNGQRIITIFGDIGTEAAYTVWGGVLKMQFEDPNSPITVILSTPGGDITEAFSIWDALTSTTCPIIMVGVGEIMSAGAFLMYAGTPGKRYLAPNTLVLTHQISYGEFGRMSAMKNRLAASERMQERFLTLMVQRANIKGSKALRRKKLEKYWLGENDSYFFAEEAIEALGLADHIGLPFLGQG